MKTGKVASISPKNEHTTKGNRERLKRMLKAMMTGGSNLRLLAAEGSRPSYRRIIE